MLRAHKKYHLRGQRLDLIVLSPFRRRARLATHKNRGARPRVTIFFRLDYSCNGHGYFLRSARWFFCEQKLLLCCLNGNLFDLTVDCFF